MDDVDRLLNELSDLPGFRQARSERIKDYLIESGYILQLRRGTLAPSELLGKLRRSLFSYNEDEAASIMLQMPSSISQSHITLFKTSGYSLRQLILSYLVALEAAKDPRVQRFRHQFLLEKLLKGYDVEWWILLQALQDGWPPTAWMDNVPLGMTLAEYSRAETSMQPLVINFYDLRSSLTVQNHYLQFSLPDSKLVYKVPITSGGALESLWDASLVLADKYGWAEDQATTFVLTGLTPLMTPMKAKVLKNRRDSFTRIILEVDPTTPPGEVERLFLQARRRLIGLRRHDMGDKSLFLALFAALRPRKEKWTQTMQEWNKAFPQWSYNRATNFGTEAIAARRRLLSPGYQRKPELLEREGGEELLGSGGVSELGDEDA